MSIYECMCLYVYLGVEKVVEGWTAHVNMG